MTKLFSALFKLVRAKECIVELRRQSTQVETAVSLRVGSFPSAEVLWTVFLFLKITYTTYDEPAQNTFAFRYTITHKKWLVAKLSILRWVITGKNLSTALKHIIKLDVISLFFWNNTSSLCAFAHSFIWQVGCFKYLGELACLNIFSLSMRSQTPPMSLALYFKILLWWLWWMIRLLHIILLILVYFYLLEWIMSPF